MILTISDADNMFRALEGWVPPDACHEVIVDCRKARRFTNCFLNSAINCRVRILPTSESAVSYAGLFSGCTNLNSQPFLDSSKCINMAAMFKNCSRMHFSLHWLQTSNVRDMRQMLMGCTYFSGNGPGYWDFSSLSSEHAMSNFATGTKFRTMYYDKILENLHRQAMAKTLPTPMRNVDMGAAKYSPAVAAKRQQLVDYGWEISDGGEVFANISRTETEFSNAVDDRLRSGSFPGDIDLSAVCTTARNGIAITPRHTLHVRHYMPRPGQPIKFWNGAEANVSKCEANPESWDIAIATLDRDVAVKPALVMPHTYGDLLPNAIGPPSQYPPGTTMPMLWFNQRNKLHVSDFSYLSSTSPTAHMTRPMDQLRLQYFGGIAVGDSGSPACFVSGNRLVVSHAIANSNGAGVWLAGLLDWATAVVSRTGHALEYLRN